MSEHNYAFTGSYPGSLSLDYMQDINFAMVHNHQSAVVSCTIHNDSGEQWSDVTLCISGEAVKESKVHIDSVSPGATIDVSKDIDIVPAPDEMIRLTEPRLTTINVCVSIAGSDVLTQELPLRLMAYDQWMGVGERPEMLAAFVMPNHPMLSRVVTAASRFMKDWTGSTSMDEYQSGDPHRVRQQVAAIYEALRSEGIIYVSSKASFETSGQRIRTVDDILTQKLGTCLDLTLLMASCLECVGIQPVLVLVSGHAFVGAWLQPNVAAMVGDDASFLLKSAADGINDIVLVETTLVTSTDRATFDDAVCSATDHLKRHDDLLCYINVAECRLNGIRPMPMRVNDGNGWTIVNDTEANENATKEVKRIDRYDLSAYDGDGTAVTKYTLWERKLLDFSLHNNLLNMKLGRKIIPIVSFNIDTLEDRLEQGRSFRVAPCPFEGTPTPTDGMYDSSLYPQLQATVTQQLENGVIFSFHNDSVLQDALKYAYRSSRTSLEENGANNLYLVLGVLKWTECERRSKPLYAPLLLLPIEIIRGSRGSGYTIRTRDEETSLNITLTEMLRQQHGIDLSVLNPLPTDHAGVDVKKILAIIRDKIRDKRGWNVIDEAMIGLFSFSKFVMWNDIHTNSALMHANPIISSLVEGRLNIPIVETLSDAKEADSQCRPDEFTIPIDVDSSQLEAIIDSGAGHSFILHGPPGTGKSQTITNMIANALYQGKRVLFVAEKMAALEVVQSRLVKIGLAPFCLELHSNKVTKQHFLRQMEMALEVAHGTPAKDYKAEADALYAKRRQLMDYVEALHGKQPGGLSLYDCITGYLSIPGEEMKVTLSRHPDITANKIEEICQKLNQLDTVLHITGHPAQNAYAGLQMRDGSADAESLLHTEIEQCDQLMRQLADPSIVQLCLDPEQLRRVSDAVDATVNIDDMRRQMVARYGQGILSTDLSRLSREWAQANAKWFLPRYFSRRSLLSRYSLTQDDVEYLIGVDERMRRCYTTAAPMEQDIQMLFGGNTARARSIMDTCRSVAASLNRIRSVADIEVPDNKLPEAIHRWNEAPRDMRNWYLWCKTKAELSALGLDTVISYILNKGKSGHEAAEAFTKGMYHAMAVACINANQQLRLFNGIMFDEVIASYRKLTAEFQELSKKELYCRLASKIPSMAMAAHDNSEVGILKRNIKNGGRGTSIRRLIDQIPTLLPKLCPCMLMSPLSAAQYIDLNNDKFDIVIFDEASQMPTSEAVGAIARGKALIVVGDPKQMPPTSFFATAAVGEDEAEIDDMESILDDCLAVSIPSKHLTWHYRSKHESLIAFSNSQYYGGRLLTFPSVDDRERKVSLRSIDGVYQRSGARVNLPEAQAVVAEVIRRLSDPVLRALSIGIVSFSKVQQDKIEDLLTDELSKRPDLEAIAYEGAEPIFIKNLENVQGDERDVILFSVGYGPDKDGKVSMNFGPLNNKGGERRLNVAVSRARYEMVVFSSMRAEHIDLRRTSSLGVEGLKKFLEFAEKGTTSISADSQNAETDSCIARMIADALRSRGYETTLGVGRSKFRVDIAVVDPKDSGRYMLGIMLDGPAYYGTKTVRDREIVQPSVLGMLHWHVMRVWTLDWYERPEQVIDNIVARIREIESKPKAEAKAPEVVMPVADQVPDVPLKAAPSAPVEVVVKEIVPVSDYTPATDVPAGKQISNVDELTNKQLLQRQLKAIVTAEQPINTGLLYKRVVKLWGLSRITPKLQTLVDEVLGRSTLYSEPDGERGKMWWVNAKAAAHFKGFRKGGERDIQDVPYIEIVNAMRFVIDQQIALDRDDLKRLTANQLGYTRKGSNIDTATDIALAMLIASAYVKVNGDKVSLAK